jgi:hypothetical protein
MRRQLLGNFSGDPGDDLRVKRFAKLAQYLRWSDDDEPVETIGVSMVIERFRDLVCKPLLCDVMPVDFFHRAASSSEACSGSPWTIRSLLARCRIIAFQNLFDHKIDVEGAASVAQEKSLLTVADKYQTVMGNDVGFNIGRVI